MRASASASEGGVPVEPALVHESGAMWLPGMAGTALSELQGTQAFKLNAQHRTGFLCAFVVTCQHFLPGQVKVRFCTSSSDVSPVPGEGPRLSLLCFRPFSLSNSQLSCLLGTYCLGTGRKQAARTVGIVDIAISALRAKLRLAVFAPVCLSCILSQLARGSGRPERKPSRS